MAATKYRHFRMDDEDWDAAARRANLEHRTMSEVLRIATRAYAEGRYDAVEPVRTTEGTRP